MKKKLLRTTAFILTLFLSAALVGCKGTSAANIPKTSSGIIEFYESYYLRHFPEAVLKETDVVVAGTIVSMTPMFFSSKDPTESGRWITFMEFLVEESLLGSVKKGDKIQIYSVGAEGKEIHTAIEDSGSFPKQGERLLYMLQSTEDWVASGSMADFKKEVCERKAFGLVDMFAGVRTVDVDGNLGYRYDPFEIGYTRDNLPFYEYKTVEQLRAALPQLVGSTKEFVRSNPPISMSDIVEDAKQDQQQDQQQDTPAHSEGEVPVESGLCSPTPEEREAMENQSRQDAPEHSEGDVSVESGLCSPTPEEREAMENAGE